MTAAPDGSLTAPCRIAFVWAPAGRAMSKSQRAIRASTLQSSTYRHLAAPNRSEIEDSRASRTRSGAGMIAHRCVTAVFGSTNG